MSDSEFDRRKEISFLQAEGVTSLPQLSRGPSVTPAFRAVIYSKLISQIGYQNSRGFTGPRQNTKTIWVEYFCKYVDEIPRKANDFREFIKSYIREDAKLLDLVQFCLRKQLVAYTIFSEIEELLRKEMIGYRFMGNYYAGDLTLLPISDQDEADTNTTNYSGLSSFRKSQEHFLQAAKELAEGHFRGSVAESINGVESVLKSVSGAETAPFGTALNILAKQKPLNTALKQGLEKLYGWTNGQDGIRHAMTDTATPVTESEAMFMLSSCIAFAAWIKREAQIPEANAPS